ncbi:hypothetical protein KGMB02408_06580 [Bacteroides faecalis]|uniref:Uncharacterized protein n=1 Tax=Bacteroides faecalis TaxID=2447885 RepID=A0A401LQG4_9BACE|nr:hypothetical protein KGMB02408_06580 [Bacteroides faecalis]
MIQMNDFVLMMLLSVVFKQREQVLYTFDYEFDVIEDHILLVYNYMDRLELLCLTKENKIVPLYLL